MLHFLYQRNCLNDPQRNFNGDADVSKVPGTTCEFEDQSKLDNWPYPACNISLAFASYMQVLASCWPMGLEQTGHESHLLRPVRMVTF